MCGFPTHFEADRRGVPQNPQHFPFYAGKPVRFDPKANRVPYSDLPDLEQYMLHRLQEVEKRTIQAYDAYEFHVVYHTLNNFCTVELSQFYFDISKDILYT